MLPNEKEIQTFPIHTLEIPFEFFEILQITYHFLEFPVFPKIPWSAPILQLLPLIWQPASGEWVSADETNWR